MTENMLAHIFKERLRRAQDAEPRRFRGERAHINFRRMVDPVNGRHDLHSVEIIVGDGKGARWAQAELPPAPEAVRIGLSLERYINEAVSIFDWLLARVFPRPLPQFRIRHDARWGRA